MDIQQRVGSILNLLRTNNNYTIEEVAGMIGSSIDCVRMREKGKSNMKVATLSKYCELYDISLSSFFEAVEDKKSLSQKEPYIKIEQDLLSSVLGKIRSSFAINKSKLANELNISRRVITYNEGGSRYKTVDSMKISFIFLYSKFFKISISDIFKKIEQ